MEKTMTIKEILENVYGILGGINVPATKIEEIGIPVARSMDGIRLCLEAIRKEEAEKEKDGTFEVTDFKVVNELPPDTEPVN